jgi:hypothetical protein
MRVVLDTTYLQLKKKLAAVVNGAFFALNRMRVNSVTDDAADWFLSYCEGILATNALFSRKTGTRLAEFDGKKI